VQLFVGVWPAPEVRSVLAGYPRPAVEGMRWSTPAQWLVVVRPLGHVADGLVPDLTAVLDAELSGSPALTASLGSPKRAEWLLAPVLGLEGLVEDVFAVTEGLVPVTHPKNRWTAHLVLARGRAKAGAYEPAPIDVTWTVTSAVLAKAVRTPEGPGYETIASFGLTPSAPS
jgi:2'-5' RNA ligase